MAVLRHGGDGSSLRRTLEGEDGLARHRCNRLDRSVRLLRWSVRACGAPESGGGRGGPPQLSGGCDRGGVGSCGRCRVLRRRPGTLRVGQSARPDHAHVRGINFRGPATHFHLVQRNVRPRPCATNGTGTFVRQGFPVPSIAPPTLLTSVAANSDPNKVDLSWATHGDVLLVTTFGSTSCPRAVEEVIRTGPRSIRLELTAPYAAAHVPPPSGGYPHVCVSDLRPYTSIVEPPTGIEPSNELDVTIDQATYHLPAR